MRGPRWLCVTARTANVGETKRGVFYDGFRKKGITSRNYRTLTPPDSTSRTPHPRARAWRYTPKTRSCYASAIFGVKGIRPRNQEISRVIGAPGARFFRPIFRRGTRLGRCVLRRFAARVSRIQDPQRVPNPPHAAAPAALDSYGHVGNM